MLSTALKVTRLTVFIIKVICVCGQIGGSVSLQEDKYCLGTAITTANSTITAGCIRPNEGHAEFAVHGYDMDMCDMCLHFITFCYYSSLLLPLPPLLFLPPPPLLFLPPPFSLPLPSPPLAVGSMKRVLKLLRAAKQIPPGTV